MYMFARLGGAFQSCSAALFHQHSIYSPCPPCGSIKDARQMAARWVRSADTVVGQVADDSKLCGAVPLAISNNLRRMQILALRWTEEEVIWKQSTTAMYGA